ncbi:MAG TPA: ATP-binding protein [Steroidobacteraceae bacterium]|nr:ATP-binding protein [Steroidobacteraceae bacterium]
MSEFLIHLVCGSTGAGKTTYAESLSNRIGGVRLSIDEWMTALFWMDSPQPLEAAWSMERVERCHTLMWMMAARIAARGVPCILDAGLGQASSRDRFVRMATELGLSTRLHFLDAPVEERWRRVAARNSARGAAHRLPFDVTREMFDFVETLWEPPTDAELTASNGVRIE